MQVQPLLSAPDTTHLQSADVLFFDLLKELSKYAFLKYIFKDKLMKKFLLGLTFSVCALCCFLVLSGCGSHAAQKDSNTSDNETHIHSFDEWNTVKQATCTEDGERERYCVCGEKQTAKIAACGHNFIAHEGKTATCIQYGWEEYLTCTSCEYTTKKTIPAYGHDLVVHEGKEATCTQPGWEEYATCKRCEYNTKQAIPALGHDIRKFEAQAATCSTAGHTAYEACTHCNYTTYVGQAALGHDFGGWSTELLPTCSADGSEVRVCRHNASHKEYRTLAKLSHTESEWNTVEPTCESAGKKFKICLVCSLTLQTQEIAPIGHDFGIWSVTKQATCITEGEETRLCSHNQSHKETRSIPKIPHTESDWKITEATCERAGSRFKECTVCSLTLQAETLLPLGHSFGDWHTVITATCMKEGEEERVCSRNNAHKETRVIEKLAHSVSSLITVNPTCTEEGLSYKECTVCHSKLETEILAATGHVSNTDYVFGGVSHYKTCKNCEEVIEYSPHDWKDNACITCGYDGGGLKGLEWTLNDDKSSYSVRGIGSVTSTELVIPDSHNGKPVTGIAANAFAADNNILSVTVPLCINEIGFEAFKGCVNLQSIILPFVGGRIDCDENAFLGYLFGATVGEENKDCVPASLKSVTVLSGTVIAEKAFLDCAGIEEIILPSSLQSIGERAFNGCSALKSITIPAKVSVIGVNAFADCNSLNEVTFENFNGWMTVDSITMNKKTELTAEYIQNKTEIAKLLNLYYAKYIWQREEIN